MSSGATGTTRGSSTAGTPSSRVSSTMRASGLSSDPGAVLPGANLLIIFSDGRDTSSWLPYFAALDLVTRADIVIYGVMLDEIPRRASSKLELRSGIRLAHDQPIARSADFLDELAERTGGASITSTLGGLRRTFAKIVSDFRSRYVLTYTPQNVSSTGWHRVDVTLTSRKGEVSARRGYERGGS